MQERSLAVVYINPKDIQVFPIPCSFYQADTLRTSPKSRTHELLACMEALRLRGSTAKSDLQAARLTDHAVGRVNCEEHCCQTCGAQKDNVATISKPTDEADVSCTCRFHSEPLL